MSVKLCPLSSHQRKMKVLRKYISMKVSNKSQIKKEKSFPATKSINIYPVPLLIELGKKSGYISDGGETSIIH